jgi:REP element-mobilizing transposase RayT
MMSRPLRVHIPGAVFHVTTRGNARRKVFLGDDDCHRFLDLLAQAVMRYDWLCYAYCLMPNHYHLVVETPSPTLSRGMQFLNATYAQSFNHQHRKVGHVVQGRFKSIIVEKESHLLELARYVALNPVRAGIVGFPEEWPWSSYQATCHPGEAPRFLAVDSVLQLFEGPRRRAGETYRRFVRQGIDRGAWKELRGSYVLGSDAFIERIRPALHDVPPDPEIPERDRHAARPSLDELFAAVADRASRNVRIHSAVRHHAYTLREVGDHLGLHFSTISRIAARVAKDGITLRETTRM